MVSIIVPIYNTEEYLAQCIESILNQTYRDLEILLINDGSTDTSFEICTDYARQDDRIRVYDRENAGPSATRNFGIQHAVGKYLMFVDSDDYMDPSMVEKMISAGERTEADYVICDHWNVATSGITRKRILPEACFYQGENYINQILIATLGPVGKRIKNPANLDRLTPIWAKLYKRSIIAENDISFVDLEKIPSECMQFNFEYCVAAQSAVYISEPLYYYRRNTGMSLTKPYRNDLIDKWMWWFDYTLDYLNVHAVKQCLPAFYSRLACSVIPLGGNAIKLRTAREKRAEIRRILSNEKIKTAYENFDYSCCPAYWKMYFRAAKKGNVYVFYLLTVAMRKILSVRKK